MRSRITPNTNTFHSVFSNSKNKSNSNNVDNKFKNDNNNNDKRRDKK